METKEETMSEDQLNSILIAVANNPELAKKPEIKSVLDMLEKSKKEKKDETHEDVKKQTIEGVEYAMNEDGDAVDDKGKVVFTKEQVEEKNKPAEEEVLETSGFGIKLKNNNKGKEGSKFLNLDEVKKWGNELGIDTKAEDWDKKLKESVSKWRKDSQELPKINEKLEGTNQFFKDVAEEEPLLANAINDYANNQSWKDNLIKKINGLDVNRKFDDIDEKTVLLHYFPGDFKAEDFRPKKEWDDEDEYEAKQKDIKRTLVIAKKQFIADQKEEQANVLLKQKRVKDLQKNYAESVKSSVAYLNELFPNFKKSKQIETVLEKGDNEILGQYMERNGTLKKDAALKLAMALQGQQEIKDLQGLIDKQDVRIQELSEELEKLVGRGKPKPDKTSKGEKPIDVVVQDIISARGGTGQRSKYF
jgi:hypothetical protein